LDKSDFLCRENTQHWPGDDEARYNAAEGKGPVHRAYAPSGVDGLPEGPDFIHDLKIDGMRSR
jgi:hypothetical protein